MFKSLSNLMNYTFKKQPTPKISHTFKIRKYRYPPFLKTGPAIRIPDRPRFSYETHHSNFYADKFADFLREQRSEGLEFIGGVTHFNPESELYEIEACFYTPT